MTLARLLVRRRTILARMANEYTAVMEEETEELEEIEMESRDNAHKDMAPEDEEAE